MSIVHYISGVTNNETVTMILSFDSEYYKKFKKSVDK